MSRKRPEDSFEMDFELGDDSKPINHGEMHYLASEILPRRHLVTAVIDALEDITLMGIATAGIIHNSSFGQLSPVIVDQLMVAALITTCPDILDIARIQAPVGTKELAKALIAFAEKPDSLPPNAPPTLRLLCESYLVAKLEIIDQSQIVKLDVTEAESIVTYGERLQNISSVRPADLNPALARVETKMTGRAVKAFNSVATRLGMNAQLSFDKNNKILMAARF